MKISTSKEREAENQPNVPEPYRHQKAIQGHVYMVTRSKIDRLVGAKYYAVLGNKTGQVRLYSLNGGTIWSNTSTFGGGNEEQWVDITDKVYLNIDGLDK